VLRRFKVVAKSRLLFAEELDLIEFLVAQIASLSSSLAHKVVTVKSPMPPPMAHEIMIPQSDPIVLCAHRRAVGDASIAIVRSSTPPLVDLELQVIGVRESFKAKPPDIVVLESGRKGSIVLCVRRSARLPTKCYGGTFVLPAPCCRLPIKVVPRRRLTCPRPCSLRPLLGGASFGHCYFASPIPPSRVGCRK
jgi:hypothetical protein